ncbi:hypothetical protein ACFL2S_00510 [Thermodesulfobacteriota bacterium]
MIIFSVFYYRIYSVTMDRMDEELLGEIEYYSEFLAQSGWVGLKKKLIEAAKKDSEGAPPWKLIRTKNTALSV